MSKFAICALSLGYTRTAGLTVYDSVTREFIETKPKDVKILYFNKYGVYFPLNNNNQSFLLLHLLYTL